MGRTGAVSWVHWVTSEASLLRLMMMVMVLLSTGWRLILLVLYERTDVLTDFMSTADASREREMKKTGSEAGSCTSSIINATHARMT